MIFFFTHQTSTLDTDNGLEILVTLINRARLIKDGVDETRGKLKRSLKSVGAAAAMLYRQLPYLIPYFLKPQSQQLSHYIIERIIKRARKHPGVRFYRLRYIRAVGSHNFIYIVNRGYDRGMESVYT